MKEFYSPTKTTSLRNKIDTFAQFPTEKIVEALEHFSEYMRAEFLEWHIDFLMRRLEKMDIEEKLKT
jgi:exoribonuclease R